MRIAVALVGLAVASVVAAMASAAPTAAPSGQLSKGLSLEQIRGVMRANAGAFTACLSAATRHNKQLHGPFLYQIEVDKKGKVTSVRPYHRSPVASFDKCISAVIRRAKFPGGPASVDAPIVFEPN